MLNDTKVRNFKASDKLYRKSDSHGLVLEVNPNGSKLWRHRYRFNGKAKMISLGSYPEVSLLDARQARDSNKQLLKQDVNPQQSKATFLSVKPTFKDMFVKWLEFKKDTWTAGYVDDTLQRANSYLIPVLGNLLIEDIKPSDMKVLLLKIQDTGKLDMLKKVKGIADGVFKYSVGMDVITFSPVRDLPSDIFKKIPIKHYATITDPKEIASLLDRLDKHIGTLEVSTALKLAPHLLLRPSELTGLLWSEIDFDEKLIRIGADRMKMKRVHLVPLSKQILLSLKALSQHETSSPFVFPSQRDINIPITPDSLRNALRNLGIKKEEFTTHSFRSMASTRLNELGYKGDVIEIQLSHAQKDKVRSAYNHAEYLPERKVMMQEWSNYLDKLQNRTPVSPSENQLSLF